MGEVFADLHREHGVDLRLGATIAEITPTGVRLEDGEELAADAVLLGVGVQPRTELAEAAGLDVDNGVLVDASLRTSDPDDLRRRRHRQPGPPGARPPGPGRALGHRAQPAGHRRRGDPGRGRGATTGCRTSSATSTTSAWSTSATRARDDTARVVVRGDVGGREFVAFWLDDQDRILAAMNVNVWDVPDEVRPLIAGRTVVDPDKLADPDTAYADVGR